MARPIIERILDVDVPEQRAHVSENGLRAWGCGLGFLRTGAGLIDFINPVGQHFETREIPVAPRHFQAFSVVQIWSGGEDADRLVARHVSAAADHFLALRDRTTRQAQARADALGVGGCPLEPHLDSARRGVVAIEAGRLVQVINDHVQIAIIVQVGQGHPVGDAQVVKSPFPICRLKGAVTPVVKRHVSGRPMWAELAEALELRLGQLSPPGVGLCCPGP